MARKRTKPTAKQAQTLLDWLVTLELPTRVINALRRDLEVVMGQREGGPGSGVLAGFDQERFIEELYRTRGGQVGQVPSVAASAIEALRAAIPAPASADGASASGDDTVQPFQGDAKPATLAEVASETAEDAQQTTLEEAPPETVEAAAAQTDALEATPASADLAATTEIAPEAASEPTDVPAAPPRRRGRPPRATAAPETIPPPADEPVAPPKRRGRPPRSEAASEEAAALPKRTRRARVAAAIDASQRAPAPAAPPAEAARSSLIAPVALPVDDPSFGVLLRLWHELHPQGQRAAMRYMAGLLDNA